MRNDTERKAVADAMDTLEAKAREIAAAAFEAFEDLVQDDPEKAAETAAVGIAMSALAGCLRRRRVGPACGTPVWEPDPATSTETEPSRDG